MTRENQTEGSFAIPWLKRREEKSPDSTIDDIDFFAMLEELARGAQ